MNYTPKHKITNMKELQAAFDKRNLDFDKFVMYVEDDIKAKRKVNISRLMEVIGSSRPTMDKYVHIYVMHRLCS